MVLPSTKLKIFFGVAKSEHPGRQSEPCRAQTTLGAPLKRAWRGFAVSAFVFGFRSLSYIPDGSEVPIRVGLQD